MKSIKVALLSNFTIIGLSKHVQNKCDELSLECEIYEADYNQINLELLQDRGLKEFKPHITFILINYDFIFGKQQVFLKKNRTQYIKNKIQEFMALIRAANQKIPGLIVISNLVQSSYSALGINADKYPMNQSDIINYFNYKLKNEFMDNNQIRIYDMNSFFMKIGENNIIDEKLRYMGDLFISPRYFDQLSYELMGYMKPFTSLNRKCIVLDLDNTLWGGILGEDGFNNIKLDQTPPGNTFMDFQQHLLALNQCGIILAINSKNNSEEALNVIRNHPNMILREENFASIQINWNDKVTNMIKIADEINIGTDSLVFLDDDPVNREMVRDMMPEVLVVDLPLDSSLYVRTLKELNDFNVLQLTDEDFKKSKIYSEQRERRSFEKNSIDIESFLKNLNIKVTISEPSEYNLPRIAQLVKKTNQFNLTTRRYSESDLKNFSDSADYLVRAVSVEDKFGDNGITGVIIIKKQGKMWLIDSLLLSCRIIGRDIEKAMLKNVIELAKKEGVTEIKGEYIPTAKNMLVKNFYTENGFRSVAENQFILKDFDNIDVNYIEVFDGN